MTQREEFEAWYASQDQSDSELERTYELSEDGMNDLTKDCLWQGWQAALAQKEEQTCSHPEPWAKEHMLQGELAAEREKTKALILECASLEHERDALKATQKEAQQ